MFAASTHLIVLEPQESAIPRLDCFVRQTTSLEMHTRSHLHGEELDGQGFYKSIKNECSKKDCCKEVRINFEPLTERASSSAVGGGTYQSGHLADQISRRSRILDIEKDEVLPEHVVLRFKGPDCAGCANKIFTFLRTLPALRGLRTNPILVQAEFDVDTDQLSISDIIDSARKATGYTCERITKTCQELEAIVPETFGHVDPMKFPKGVKDVVFISKNTINIQYDAEVIGARDLLSTGFGIALHPAPSRPRDGVTGQIRKTTFRTGLSCLLTIPILIFSWAPLPKHEIEYGAVSLVLATIVQVVVAGPFYPSAFRSLFFARTFDMGLLVVLSTTTAYIVSVVSFIYTTLGINLLIGVNFETSALLVTLIMVGRLLTAYTCQRAMKRASFRSLQPDTAFVMNMEGPDKSAGAEFDIRLLQYGDVFKVEPDSRIVTDGIVVSGIAYVDESLMTGESSWLEKKSGSSVIAGSINRSGTLEVQLERLPGSNTIDEIANMVDEVTFSKPKIQETADKFARYFVPAIGLIAFITLCVWLVVGICVLHHPASTAIVIAVLNAISVLVVSCPCAIGLAVPLVMVITSGVIAKCGVIIKSAGALQVARKITHAVFDKTGTLTESHLSVSAETYVSEPPSFTASLILGLTVESKHPVASTVAKHVGSTAFSPAPVENIRNVLGKGILGILNGESVRIGSSSWIGVEDHSIVKSLLSQGYTVSCIAKGYELLAVFGLAASLRHNASAVIQELLQRKIDVSIISGDNIGAVHQAATNLNIPLKNTKSRCSPAEKQQYVKFLMQNPKNTVLFCGDGTNDAAALAQADVGVYLSSSFGVIQIAADVVLMRPSLNGILTLIDLSHDAFRRICFNFAWSAIYNVVAILLAAGVFVNVRLPPEYAGLGEAVSVLPVLVVAFFMKRRD